MTTTHAAASIRDRVVAIRSMIKEASRKARERPGVDPLRSVFLIGSCSGDITDEWYQDFDIHFLFDGIALTEASLAWLAALMDGCRAEGDERCRVEAFVKDRHWKMVPNASVGDNIGVHATLLNSADHYRRLHVNPVLAANMYVRCGVVHGDHPATIRGWRPVGAAEYAHGVGGIGWLAENFARAVSLYVLAPDDHTFYPFIGGYTWNIASSALFHLHSLRRGGVSGREGAYQDFVADASVPASVPAAAVEAARLLHAHREDPSAERAFGRRQINAAATVLDVVAARFAHRLPAYYGPPPTPWVPGAVAVHTALYGGPVDGLDVVPDVVDVLRDEGTEYYDSVAAALAAAERAAGGPVSPKENFEFVRDVATAGGPVTKVRVWDSVSLPRRLLSADYAAVRGQASEADVVFGWEDGMQALLQRLHEVGIELGRGDPAVATLAGIVAGIASARLAAAGVDARVAAGTPAEVRAALAALVGPHVEPVFPGVPDGTGR